MYQSIINQTSYGRTLFHCLLLFLTLGACTNETVTNGAPALNDKGNQIVIGTIDTLYSKVLGETRTLWIHVPESLQGSFLTNKRGYPVLYLLDAEVNFHSVVGTLHNLSRDNWNCKVPQMIVVGITNTNRFRDLSPTHVDSALGMDKRFASETGGGERFTAFVEKELMPYIEKRYRTQPYRLLIGHSLAGLYGIHTLLTHPKLFQSCIAIDPSLHWDHQKLLEQYKKLLSREKWNGSSLYLAIARNWPSSLDTSDIRKSKDEEYINQRCLLSFTEVLRSHPHNGMNSSYNYYREEDHVSVPHIAIYDGLRYIFRNFELPSYTDLHAKQFNADSFIRVRYEQLYKESGYRFDPPEVPLYLKIINLLSENKPDKAYPLIQIMMKHYPNTHVYWSLGEYHKLKGNKALAIENFKKSLEFEEDPGVREELDELQRN